MSTAMIEKLKSDYYTTEQVAEALGRCPVHWCRIRQHYIANYNLHVIRIGRSIYYEKAPVDKMIKTLLQEGDQKKIVQRANSGVN